MFIKNNLKILEGLDNFSKSQVLEIFYEAFIRQFNCIFRSKARALNFLEKVININNGFYAIYNDKIVGIGGIHYGNNVFINRIRLPILIKDFGIFRGLYLWIIYWNINPKLKKEELRVDTIAVAKSLRCKGIGTKILREIFKYTKKNGFTLIRLEVINTNIRARKLYERLGFIVTRVKYSPFNLGKGFISEIIMYKQINL